MALTALVGSASIALAGPIAPAGKGVKEIKEVAPPVEREDIPVHPITAPYFHEDSFIGTDVRPVFVYHKFPGEILGGNRATVTALQLRIQLTKSLQFVAYKDGFVDIETPALKQEGWNDIAAGLKWAFYQNDAQQLHAAVGAGYEFASGDDEVLQDDDEVRLWFSVNKGFGNLHLGVNVNYLMSMDNGDDILGNSDMLTWHFHADYQVCKWFSPVIEVNGFHTTDEDSTHNGVITPFSGVDVADLGGNAHEDTITGAIGAEVRPFDRIAVRAAYEIPLTGDLDVYGHRWTFSAVIKF